MKQLICHRGASAYAPENTLAAFKAAQNMGCSFVEFDVMLSADGETFVFHDGRLNGKTNGRGQFALATAEEIKALDAGSWFSKRFRDEKIPALGEVLQWLASNKMQANIEIKPCPNRIEETTTAVLTAIHRYWPSDRELPLISSFDVKALRFCHHLAPEFPLGLLLDKWDDNWLKLAKELDCVSVHVNQKALTKARVAEIKQHGYKLYSYTVNRKRRAEKILSWGVDAVFTDYPDLLI